MIFVNCCAGWSLQGPIADYGLRGKKKRLFRALQDPDPVKYPDPDPESRVLKSAETRVKYDGFAVVYVYIYICLLKFVKKQTLFK